jgi:hypothetical protein
MVNLIISGTDRSKSQLLKGRIHFMLENLDGKTLSAPVNGRYLKHYMQ